MKRLLPYIWAQKDWPSFRWDSGQLLGPLADARRLQGAFLGRLTSLGLNLTEESRALVLCEETIHTAAIEGQILNREAVRSSVARRLGVDVGALAPGDRNVDGVVEMMLDATQNHEKPLTRERLLGWHASLFPTGYSGLRRINVGAWRDDAKGPMQVVSGPVGRERVHFEAPAAARLEREMNAFLDWFNRDEGTDLVLRAGIAHLWFVTIHPFDDGNGRIARALADMMLARSEGSPQRFYSMSAQIRIERDAYFGGLEETQKGTLDITVRLEWFLACLDRALDGAESTLAAVLRKARFWESSQSVPFNERQRLLLNKLLDGFDGKLTSSKWARIAKCSQDTALRDILDLVKRGILTKDSAGGRSASYSLKELSQQRGNGRG